MVKHWMSSSAAVAGAAHSIRALLPPLWNRSLILQEGGNACPQNTSENGLQLEKTINP